MEKPEALRLADELDDVHTTHVARNAAAELRRLHAENASLTAALASSCDEQRHQLWESGGIAGCERARVAERQRDALLRAMKLIQHATSPTPNDGGHHEAAHDISSAAIALCEGLVAAVEGETK